MGLEVGEPELAAEAYGEIGGSPQEERWDLSDTEIDDRGATGRNMCIYNHSVIVVLTSSSHFCL